MDEEYSTSLRIAACVTAVARGDHRRHDLCGQATKNFLEVNQKGRGIFPLRSRIVRV